MTRYFKPTKVTNWIVVFKDGIGQTLFYDGTTGFDWNLSELGPEQGFTEITWQDAKEIVKDLP